MYHLWLWVQGHTHCACLFLLDNNCVRGCIRIHYLDICHSLEPNKFIVDMTWSNFKRIQVSFDSMLEAVSAGFRSEQLKGSMHSNYE